MAQTFRFQLPQLPHLSRLHQRGQTPTIACDTTKGNTQPKRVNGTPSSNERPIKTETHIRSWIERPNSDYFGFPFYETGGKVPRANATVKIKAVPLPVEEFKSLQTRLHNAQLNEAKIKALTEDLKNARMDILRQEGKTRFYYWELEEAKEELRELRAKIGKICQEELLETRD